MLEKDPKTVINCLQALERYLDEYLAEAGTTFEEWVPRFGRDFYAQRNELIASMLAPLGPRRVLELACAGPYLAKTLLADLPGISRYTCSNLSDRMIEFCEAELAHEPRCDVAVIDAEPGRSDDLTRACANGYDTFITTSLEHIQADREMVAIIPPGATLVCSVARFDDVEHFRVFETPADIHERFGDLLEVLDIQENNERNKFVLAARRLQSATHR